MTQRTRGRGAGWLAWVLALTALGPAAGAHSPHDVINQLAVTTGADGRAVIYVGMKATAKSLIGRSLDGGATWRLMALPREERDFTAIAISPGYAQDGEVVIATNDVGLMRSQDGGESWHVMTAAGLDPRVLALTHSLDYAVDQRLLAGTITGLFRSDDGGATWQKVTDGITEGTIGQVASAPGAPQVLFAGRRVLHRSDDGGMTWTPLHDFGQQMSSLAVSPDFAADGTLVVALGSGQGVFTSTDGGASWLPMVDGLVDPMVNDVALSSDGMVYAVTKEAGLCAAPLGQPFTLHDDFELKSDLTTDHYRQVAVSPVPGDEDVVWVGAFEGLFLSEDAGQSFRQLDVYGQRYNRQIVFPPDWSSQRRLFFVNYGGGLLRSPLIPTAIAPDGGMTPAAAPALAPAASVGAGVSRAVLVHAVGPDGKPPAPGGYETRSQGLASLFGQSLVLSPQFTTDGTMFYAQGTLHRSDDAGLSWSILQLPPSVTVVRALALAPDFPSDTTLFLGGGADDGAFRSPDAGATWIGISAGLPSSPTVSDILLSPTFAQDRTVYLLSRKGGVFRSVDAGDTWSASNTGLPSVVVESLVMSPEFLSDTTMFAGVDDEGVYRSTDAGASWHEANAGLPTGQSVRIESFAVSPAFGVDRTVFAMTLNAGLFKSTDAGDSWVAVGAGLPPDAGRVVAVSPTYDTDRIVVVSTYGWSWISHDGGHSFKRLPGFALHDNQAHLLDYTVVAPTDAAAGGDARDDGPDDDVLTAWLKDGACPGETAAASAAADAGLVWPLAVWPQGCHGTNVSVGETPGDSVSLHFVGDSVTWHAVRGPDQGLARVLVDGALAAVVDLYAPAPEPSAAVFSLSFPAVAPHRIKVLVTGLAQAAASDHLIRHDGFGFTY